MASSVHEANLLERLRRVEGQVRQLNSTDLSGAFRRKAATRVNTYVVAAGDAPIEERQAADYVCGGQEDGHWINRYAQQGNVELTNGTYYINSESVLMQDAIEVRGKGAGTVITYGAGATATQLVHATDGITNWRLANLKLYENGTSNVCLEIEDCQHFEVEAVYFEGGSRGIRLEGDTKDYLITGCSITLSSTAIQGATSTSTRGLIQNNLISSTAASGILMTGFDLSILGNSIFDCGGRGIWLVDTTACLVSNNTVRGCGSDAILIENTDQAVILGNTLSENLGSGIFWDAAGGNQNLLIGNVIRSNNIAGISVTAGDMNLIIGNFIRNNSQVTDDTHDGIIVNNNADDTVILGNIIHRGTGAQQQRYGINIASVDCNDTYILNNRNVLGGKTANLNDSGTGTITTLDHAHGVGTGGNIAAANVDVADAGGLLTASDVEAALAEIVGMIAAGSGAPTNVDYLVGTANATLTNEIVVGTTPGGQLGNTWASPTVDTVHAEGSHSSMIATHAALPNSHHNEAHAIGGAAHTGSLDHGALSGLSDNDHTIYAEIANAETITAAWTLGAGGKILSGGTNGQIVMQTGVGVPSHVADEGVLYINTATNIVYVNITGGSSWQTLTALHEAEADPHAGYRKESDDHSHASAGAQGGTVSHDVLTGVSANDHHNEAHAIGGAAHTGTLNHADLGSVTANQHHNEAHSLVGAQHTSVGADGEVLANVGGSLDMIAPKGSIEIPLAAFRILNGTPALTTRNSGAGYLSRQGGLAFDGAAQEAVGYQFACPADYGSGGTIHINWYNTVVGGAADDVDWEVRVGAYAAGEVRSNAGANWNTNATTANMFSAAQYTGFRTSIVTSTAIAVGDTIYLNIGRDGTADTEASDVDIDSIQFEYVRKIAA